jgi:hypothetical protein
MIRWFKKLLFDSTPAEFTSDFSIAESVERLSKGVRRVELLTLFGGSIVGTVSQNNVQLTRARSTKGKSYGTYYRTSFCGEFQEHDGRVLLTGQFQLAKGQRRGLLFALCFLPFATLIATGQFFGPTPEIGFISLFPIAMFIGIFSVTAYDKSHCSQHDVVCLSKTIKHALSDRGGVQTNYA